MDEKAVKAHKILGFGELVLVFVYMDRGFAQVCSEVKEAVLLCHHQPVHGNVTFCALRIMANTLLVSSASQRVTERAWKD